MITSTQIEEMSAADFKALCQRIGVAALMAQDNGRGGWAILVITDAGRRVVGEEDDFLDAVAKTLTQVEGSLV